MAGWVLRFGGRGFVCCCCVFFVGKVNEILDQLWLEIGGTLFLKVVVIL